MPKTIEAFSEDEVRQRMQAEADKRGSITALARLIGLSPQQTARMLKQDRISNTAAQGVGMERQVVYTRRKST